MRYAFVKELTKQAEKNKNIMLLTGDLGYSVFEEFRDKFPKQFINAGVAESNMMGVATGLAMSGKIVFVYSIATFATLTAFESIRNDIALHNAHVIIVGSGAGISYADAGASHHAVEDIALLRTIPNMHIFAPADPVETAWATKMAIVLKKPTYLRLGKRGEPVLYAKAPDLKFGKGSILKTGSDFAIISTGNIVYNSLLSAQLLEKRGLKGTVVSMHTLKPIDKKLIKQICSKFKHIFTVEEHYEIGGLGSIVSDIIVKEGFTNKLTKIALPDIFIREVGTQEFLRKKYNLSPEKIAKTILSKI
jgi:transketolase